jgi:hypothetical protein
MMSMLPADARYVGLQRFYEIRDACESRTIPNTRSIPSSAAQFIFEGVCGSNDDGIETVYLHQYPQMDMTSYRESLIA